MYSARCAPQGLAGYPCVAGLVPSSEEDRLPVANIKSQIKRNRQNEARRVRNKAVRSELKTRRKVALAAVAAGSDQADVITRLAIQRIDMAATKNVIHKNKAARDKSRLMRRLNAARV